MKRTRLLAILLIALVTLSLVACNQTTLAAPERLTVENDTLRWNSVNGAKSYSIAVDGLEKAQTTNNYYSLDSLGLEAGETYEFRVKAIGDGYIYLNSEFSKAYSFNYVPTVNGGGSGTGGNSGGGNTDSGNAGIENNGGGTIPVQESKENFFYKPHPNSGPVLKDSFSDGKFYYYYYHLGYLENFPLVYSSTKNLTQDIKDAGVKISFEEEIAAESQSSIEESVNNSVTEQTGGSTSWEKGFEFEIGKDGLFALNTSTNVTKEWNWEHSKTYSTAHSVASSWLSSIKKSVALEFTENTKVGFYRYIQYTKRCDIFALVVYDTSSREFSWEYLSYAEEGIKSMQDMFEYSVDGSFESNNENTLTFDKSVLGTINTSNAPEYKGPVVEAPATPIKIPVNRHHCAHDTGYDLTTDGDSKNAVKDHSLYEMGHLVFYGCKKSGEIFRIAEPENFKLEYIFEEDPSDLPSTGSGDLRISDDSSKTVLDTDIRNTTIGKGAYEVKIKYKNGSTAKTVTVTDFMEGKSRGSAVDMLNVQLNGVDLSKIAEIKVTIVYELYYWANIGDHHHSDWRCDYVFIFE